MKSLARLGCALALAGLVAAPAHAFKLRDLLEGAIQQQQPQEQPASTDAAGAEKPPEKQKFDAAKLGFALFGDYSPEQETQIGQQLAGDLLGAAPLVKDDRLQNYVNLVGRWVAQQSGRSDISWHFGVIDSDDINAFAAPGGYVFVTRGLYRQLTNEAELAGVLGHEIAHVTKKHHLKVLKKSTLIGELGKVAGHKAGDNQTVQNLIGNGAEMLARGLDKDAEFEADRVGMVLAARAGYSPWGLPEVLQDLAELPAGDSRTSFLYRTHPLPADRLAKLGEAVGDRFDGIGGVEDAGRFYRLK